MSDTASSQLQRRKLDTLRELLLMTSDQGVRVQQALTDRHWSALPMALDRGRGWSELREAGSVVLMDGWYYLTHRDDVLFALRNPELFSSQKTYDNLGSPLPLIPLGLDPPEHTRYRHLLQPFFSPKELGHLLPSLRQQAVKMIDDIAPRGECDAVSQIAVPYPSQVFLSMFGLPLEDRDKLIAWKDASIALSELPSLEGADMTEVLGMFSYLQTAVAARRDNPGQDILSQLVTGADALTDTEALGLCFLFVLAGLDTVTSALGSALHALATDANLRKLLIDKPDQIKFFIEEVVRIEPPAAIVQRITTTEVELRDQTLPADTPVRLCLGAINRDGSDEGSTDYVVMDEKIHRHWAYGGGPHRCLGAHLARMELGLITEEWLKRIPDFSVKAGHQVKIVWPSNTFSLESLPLVW